MDTVAAKMDVNVLFLVRVYYMRLILLQIYTIYIPPFIGGYFRVNAYIIITTVQI